MNLILQDNLWEATLDVLCGVVDIENVDHDDDLDSDTDKV
jgi:hypothetical protein